MAPWAIPLMTVNIEKKGVYDFEQFYRDMKEWAGNQALFFNEKVFSMSKSGEGNEVSWNYELTKKFDNYFQIRIAVNLYVFRQIEVLVKVDGKQITMNQGFVAIQIKPKLEIDYLGIFKGKGISKLLQKLYQNYIISGRIGARYGYTFETSVGLIKAIRKSLGMDLGL